MALIIVIVIYFFVIGNINQIKQNEVKKNLEITKCNAGFIESLVLGKLKETVNLTESHHIVELDSRHLAAALKTFKTSENVDLFIATKDGKILASTRTTTINKISPSNNPYLVKAIQGQPQIASQVRSVFTGDYVVTIYAPIFNTSHDLVGIIGNELPVAFFEEYLAPVTIGDTGYLNLIDQNGYYIYDKNIPDRKKLTPARCYQEETSKDIFVNERISSRTGQMTMYTRVRLKHLGWYILSFQQSSEIIASGSSTIIKNIIFVLMSIVTLVILWLYKTALVNKNRLIRTQNSEKLALVGELAASMAHEIRNPLTTIRGFSQILQNTNSEQNHKEIFDLVIQSVDHIDNIVKETLLLAKPQQMKLDRVNLQDILRETYNIMINESLLREVSLELELSSQEAFVIGDRVHLKQVLINIIKNSLEATPKHGIIKIRLERTLNRFAKIFVSDTGPGINPKIINKIGTPFFTTKDEGTGLGLSVCKRIIEEHKGALKINSKEGFGTTIGIEIPVVS
jgi:signal transduction histidine kinase